jgi:hypothetical protein
MATLVCAVLDCPQAKANVEVLKQTEIIRNVQNILNTNVSGEAGRRRGDAAAGQRRNGRGRVARAPSFSPKPPRRPRSCARSLPFAVCSALGPPFTSQLNLIFVDMLSVYK